MRSSVVRDCEGSTCPSPTPLPKGVLESVGGVGLLLPAVPVIKGRDGLTSDGHERLPIS
jgi:hypothetical protein